MFVIKILCFTQNDKLYFIKQVLVYLRTIFIYVKNQINFHSNVRTRTFLNLQNFSIEFNHTLGQLPQSNLKGNFILNRLYLTLSKVKNIDYFLRKNKRSSE